MSRSKSVLPATPGHRGAGALDEIETGITPHRTPPSEAAGRLGSLTTETAVRSDRSPGADCNRGGYRGNSLAHASRVGPRGPDPSRQPGEGVMDTATAASTQEPLSATIKQVPRSGTVRTNGQELFYEIHGDGPPLVLVMGIGYDSSLWTLQQVPVLSTRFSVVLLDNRDAGRSSRT